MEIEGLHVSAYTVPTDGPRSDGTLTWDRTTVVVVEPAAGGTAGLGFTYGPAACGAVVDELLRDAVVGLDAMDVPGAWKRMVDAVRNAGRPGIASLAIAAVDTGLWDLKARVLGVPLFRLLGAVREEVPVYWSGGFCSTPEEALADELGGWVHDRGIPRVKMKIGARWGADPASDVKRVAVARQAVGSGAELMVDANGGYSRKQAAAVAGELEPLGVTWFEEPVSSDDLEGLAEIRGLTEIEIAAGEYGYDSWYFRRMAPYVDVLQADVSRCLGVSEWLRAAAVAGSFNLQVSGHTAQSLHAHPACAVPNLRHLEYFSDHHRVDRLLFDGVLDPAHGVLRPDAARPGMGLELKRADADRYRVA